MRVRTIGHGTRSAEELVRTLVEAQVAMLVDVRRFPSSRRNPQFTSSALAATLGEAGVTYTHEPELGGRRSAVPGEDRFHCLRVSAFRSYAAWMGTEEWAAALTRSLVHESPCFMCAETLPWRCHRRLIADVVVARGVEVEHLLGPGESLPHRAFAESEVRDGGLYLCGSLVV
jgi:uncharacterized protein (DUF488 family)